MWKEGELVRPDWRRWRRAAAVALPILLLVSIANAVAIRHFAPSNVLGTDDFDRMMREGRPKILVQSLANATALGILGIHSLTSGLRAARTAAFPPVGMNVLLPTRRRHGKVARGYGFGLQLFGAAVILNAIVQVWGGFWSPKW